MFTKEAAAERVQKYLDEVISPHVITSTGDKKILIVDADTLEYDFGWVFFHDSRDYIQTGNRKFRLLGTTPIIFDKRDGSLHTISMGGPIEFYVENYRKYGSPYPPN